ncbi:MAG: hypothetical protein R6U93_00405, partial [Dehalococcoidia bacterium]
ATNAHGFSPDTHEAMGNFIPTLQSLSHTTVVVPFSWLNAKVERLPDRCFRISRSDIWIRS